jgi:hypothetical protein
VARHGLAELPDDEQTVTQIAVGQAEFADLLVHTGGWWHTDPCETRADLLSGRRTEEEN